MKNELKEIEKNQKASEEFQKKISKALESMSKEEKEKLFNAMKSGMEPLVDAVKAMHESMEKIDDVIVPTFQSISEAAAKYETCMSDAKYEGVNIEAILSKYSNQIDVDDICRATGIKPSAMSKYVHNRAVIPADKLIKLSDVSGVSMELLLKQEQRTLKDDFIDSKIELMDLELDSMSTTRTGEEFKLSKNLPKDFYSIKAYRIDYKIPFFGVEVNPILIVDESWENPVFYGNDPFLAIVKFGERYLIKQIQRIGRGYMIQWENRFTPVPIELIKQNIAGVIIKVVFDF